MSTTPAPRDLVDRVCLVAGATRGCGRAIAVALGERGATVYATGRSTRAGRSPVNRPETIEDTGELVSAAGGTAIALRCDHSDPDDVRALADRIRADHGRLDVLVNDVWGGEHLLLAVGMDTAFWTHDPAAAVALVDQGIHARLVTATVCGGLLVDRPAGAPPGLHIEVTDGTSDRYRGVLSYDLAKSAATRMAKGLAIELTPHGVTVLSVSPGFLRSEQMLDHFGVTEETWREGIARDEHFAFSETPALLGRGLAALVADPEHHRFSDAVLGSWDLMHTYGVSDVDGTQPDWGAHAREIGVL